ncbi:hypothetical protein HPB52_025528 [Rhipicephalus sanguineus]|uniref:CN hydrolase domain-containing protein n=1 Tax=Rhipicephalus sanguineus TaxID=34632 RepID=A0A9D4SM84_RHISA|nr:hypothetical protein HPB52_025528 [Rhipicephalus sanguineus]
MKADIIVFPEDGILYRLKDREEVAKWAEDIPDVGVMACGSQNTSLLSNLSCMAQNNDIYLVANLIDRKPCNESDHSCPRDKVKYFNTNVAFDRNGTLVARLVGAMYLKCGLLPALGDTLSQNFFPR